MTWMTKGFVAAGRILAVCLMIVVLVQSSVAGALDDATQGLLFPMYGENGTCGSVEGVDASYTTDSGLNLNEYQVKFAKIILGITKSMGLNDKAGEIAIMTALAESHIRMYASDRIPVSKENPEWLALPEKYRVSGMDHMSVGFFQQQVTTGWSTFGNGTSKEIVWQLMSPAYGAEAFLGVPDNVPLPSGLKQPSALRKGLQNLKDWQSMEPWVAAQKVQISAFDGRPRKENNFSSVFGGNYKDKYAEARSIVAKYWNESPAVPLPIALNGNGAATTTNIDCAGVGTGDYAAIISKVKAYAWETYTDPNYFKMKSAYKTAVDAAKDPPGDYVGGGPYPGIDCGGFVTRVMRDSGADPKYNDKTSLVTAQLEYVRRHPEMYEEKRINSTKDIELNTIYIWINNDASHTYLYVGPIPGFQYTAASASYGSWRTPMSDQPYGFGSEAHWFKVKVNNTAGAVSI